MTVQPFNFRAPPAGRFESAAREWLTAACRMSPRGPLALEMRLDHVEPILPADLLRTFSDSIIGLALEINGLPTFVAVERPVLLALLAGLLGEAATALPADREFTPVESDMVGYLVPQLLQPLQSGWTGADPLGLKVLSLGAPRATCRLAADVVALAGTLQLRGPFGEAPVRLLIPTSLMPIETGAGTNGGPFDRPVLEMAIRELPLEFCVDLGRARLTLGRLQSLRAGDVILLDQRVGEPLRAKIGDSERFDVWAGAHGQAQAIRVHAIKKRAS
jgi:flagellar motor switch protein FliM